LISVAAVSSITSVEHVAKRQLFSYHIGGVKYLDIGSTCHSAKSVTSLSYTDTPLLGSLPEALAIRDLTSAHSNTLQRFHKACTIPEIAKFLSDNLLNATQWQWVI